MKNIIVIYHQNCMDGTAAAWVAYQKFGKDAEYIAASDRINLPDYVTCHTNISDVEVYILDFCLPRHTMLGLESKCKKLVVLDHHESVKSDIESVKTHVYGVEKSGCMLTWEYFFPEFPAPLAIQYVSDSDTWTHTMPDYQYVDAYIYKSEQNTDNIKYFDNIVSELNDKSKFENLKSIGKYLHETHMNMCKNYADKAELVNFAGYQVYAVNAPAECRSQTGHILAEKTGTFSMCYYYIEGKLKVSLRSVKDFDCSVIAKEYGGGGHKNAASFFVPRDNPILSIIK
jgi:oligoribonuclease NrnB/cAMP/cGMP phosphodiesterase (DHH superfamily)